MSMDDMERALALVREHEGEGDFVGPRGELLAAAEAALGHPLPPTYRRFIEELGAGDIAGVEIYGVIHGDFESSGIPDAIWLTLDERSEWGLPPGLVPVAQDIEGNAYIDMRGREAGAEGPVIAWIDQDTPAEELAPDFGSFLLAELEGAL
jgi:antitoxin YobK